jgi:MoxR-like ATPase
MTSRHAAAVSTLEKLPALEEALGSVIRGKAEAVRLAVVCLLARGHLLIEDVPGVGKTTLAHTLARCLDCGFHRVQFTSDMLPSDLLGVTIYSSSQEEFEFKRGPIFTNILLADEINRTTPKTQSALLEAMNERQVTIEGRRYPLPEPFMVIATQNPIEYHGTYPLPESQMDRFLMRIRMGYPDAASEREILRSDGRHLAAEAVTPVLSGEEVVELQQAAGGIRVDETVVDYLMAIVEKSRSHEHLALGSSPRGTIALYRAAQALALMEGLDYCTPDHVKRLVVPVFAHRVAPDPRYGGNGTGVDRTAQILEEILHSVEVPL